jgi:hypothetical protein
MLVLEPTIDDRLETLANGCIQRRHDKRGQHDRGVGRLPGRRDEQPLARPIPAVNTPARIAVSDPYTSVRLMSRSISYSR